MVRRGSLSASHVDTYGAQFSNLSSDFDVEMSSSAFPSLAKLLAGLFGFCTPARQLDKRGLSGESAGVKDDLQLLVQPHSEKSIG